MDGFRFTRQYTKRGMQLGLVVGVLLAGWAALASGDARSWRPLGAAALSAWLGFPFGFFVLPLVGLLFGGWASLLLPVLPVTLGWAGWGFVLGCVRDGLARQQRSPGSRRAA